MSAGEREDFVSLEILNKVYEASLDSEDLHEYLLNFTTDLLELRYGFIGRRRPTNSKVVDIISLVKDGEVQECFSYDLENTPCDVVFDKRAICNYPEKVTNIFPKDQLLIDMGIESYIGCQLRDQDHILVFMHDKPFEKKNVTKPLVEFLAYKVFSRIQLEVNKKNKSILNELFNQLEGIFLFKDKDRVVTHCSHSISELAGLSPEEVIGKKLEEFYPEELVKIYNERDDEAIKDGKSKSFIEEAIDPDGLVRTYQTQRFPLFDSANNIIGVGLIGIDITEQKEKEEEALHQERLKEIGEQVALTIHEINNPLAIIGMGYQSLKRKASEMPDGMANILSLLEEPIERVERIVKDIRLKSHRNQAGQPDIDKKEIFNLESLLGDTCESQKFFFESSCENFIYENRVSGNAMVLGDKRKTRQIIVNLISNAIDAMKDSSIKDLKISLEEEDSSFLIKVIDSGIGIPKEVQEDIFSHFYTTKPIGEGSGIGLHFVKQVMTEHGGTITFSSELGKGTEFILTFPKAT